MEELEVVGTFSGVLLCTLPAACWITTPHMFLYPLYQYHQSLVMIVPIEMLLFYFLHYLSFEEDAEWYV